MLVRTFEVQQVADNLKGIRQKILVNVGLKA